MTDFVAKDKGGDWYHVGNGMYHCLDKSGGLVGKVAGKYLPDPMELWQTKCQQKEVGMQSMEGNILRPNDVVFKLWEHHNAQSNNNV